MWIGLRTGQKASSRTTCPMWDSYFSHPQPHATLPTLPPRGALPRASPLHSGAPSGPPEIGSIVLDQRRPHPCLAVAFFLVRLEQIAPLVLKGPGFYNRDLGEFPTPSNRDPKLPEHIKRAHENWDISLTDHQRSPREIGKNTSAPFGTKQGGKHP